MKTSPILFLLLMMAGCSGAPGFEAAPRVLPNDNSAAPLAFEVEVLTDEPTRIRLEVDGGEPVEFPAMSTEHRIPILGLKPSRAYKINIIATDEDGNESPLDAPLDIQTPSLPDVFPQFRVPVSEPAMMEPGITIFNLNAAPSGDPSYIVAVDSAGDVIWYYKSDFRVSDVRRIRNGNLVYLAATGGIQNQAVEINMLGRVVRRWHADAQGHDAPAGSIPIATDSLHHEIFETSDGNFLTLSSALRAFDNYPTSETQANAPRAKALAVDDVVVEFKPDGTIVDRWSLMDGLDPYRIGYGSLGQGWNSTYPHAGGPTRDWGHGNAVVHDERDDSLIVSLYTQDAVVKFNRKTGELIWILGTPEGWGPTWQPYLLKPEPGDFEWPFHQHSPQITASGTLMLFDNGAYRARPFTPGMPWDKSYSRAVEYAIDETNRTVRQVWKYGGPGDEIFFSRPLGDADWLPQTGNVLVTDGARGTDAQGRPGVDFSRDNIWARVVEVTHTTPARKVFELIVQAPIVEGRTGWYIYRAERLPSIYP